MRVSRHFNVTVNPTAEWTGQQILEALPWVDPPRYLLRDRDAIYGTRFRKRVGSMGFDEVLIAPRSPWQSPYVERLIGTIRRERVFAAPAARFSAGAGPRARTSRSAT